MSNAFPATTPGRIATDPQFVSGQNPRLAFRLAVDDRSQRPDGEWATRQTVFHDVVVFGRSASTLADMYRKGDPVLVSGEVRFNNYTTQAGERHTDRGQAGRAGPAAVLGDDRPDTTSGARRRSYRPRAHRYRKG